MERDEIAKPFSAKAPTAPNHRVTLGDGRALLLVCSGLLILAILASCLDPPDRTSGTSLSPTAGGATGRIFIDPEYGLRLSIPVPEWEIVPAARSAQILVALRAVHPVEGFTPTVTVTLEPLGKTVTALEYGEAGSRLLERAGFSVLFTGMTVINRVAFHEMLFVNRNVAPALRHHCFSMVKDRTGLVLTCSAPDDRYNEFKTDFDIIIRSCRFAWEL